MTTDVQYNFDELCLQDLFITQAKKTPDAIAVVDGTIEMTYKELDEVSSRLAIQLIEEYGVEPDAVVGILLPRSVQYVISYVAILKAGGAYMPLELVYPKQLLERAVLETHSKVVLTNEMYANRVAELPHLVLGKDREAKGGYVNYETSLSYPPASYVHPHADHLAFCVMSSGTTGTPKGICQTHRAAVHSYLDRYNRFPYESSGDRVGAGVFFVWELYRPLCFGATCVVIPDHVLFDPHSVTKFVQDYQITRWLVTPSLMQLILDTVNPDTLALRLAHLRYMWFCGEVVSTDLAQQTTGLLPHMELMNLYSISECHDVSIGDLKRELDPEQKYATCGKAIPQVNFYIVDLEQEGDEMKLVEDGQTGEVYVGGPVVGRGYLNMPEKTAERFVPNPFDDSCPRLYKTGDLGRIESRGQLEILGRCDFMVKIRGYSVVLGAIETALAKHPKLSSSVVLAVGSEGSRDKKLVAYVVPTEWKNPPSAASVRAFLKDHVPNYAIPSTFCVINALPVAATAAGKLDRKKLPAPEQATRLRAFSEDFDGDAENANPNALKRLAPETEEETAILDIWSDLLSLEKEELSVEESFFEVGGHSLLATQLVARVNERFGKTTENGLTIMNIVEAPTIREMAKIIVDVDAAKKDKPKIDLQQEAQTLDPSIFPFPTRKGNTMARFRMESSVLLRPRVVFLTGATGYLGAHILSELLQSGVTVIALARANDNDAARERLLNTMQKYALLDPIQKTLQQEEKEQKEDEPIDLEHRLVAVAGDLSQPLLGIDNLQFKCLALEIDTIIHCGAQVNLIKPYQALKESNVLGTQEILRLATTNGFVRTKVKPVYYISTNGIFPVTEDAYPDKPADKPITVPEDVHLNELAPHLDEGYAQTKWVAEEMCNIAESRGLPVSVLRPGNMAGSTATGIQNQDDLNFLLLQGILEAKCAPTVGTNYALDMTPVNFAAKAVVHFSVNAPQTAIGQRMHLQNPQEPVSLQQVVAWMREHHPDIEDVSREVFMERIAANPSLAKLSAGYVSFEKYFEASTWLQFGSNNLQQTLPESVRCPQLDSALLGQWFPSSSD